MQLVPIQVGRPDEVLPVLMPPIPVRLFGQAPVCALQSVNYIIRGDSSLGMLACCMERFAKDLPPQRFGY